VYERRERSTSSATMRWASTISSVDGPSSAIWHLRRWELKPADNRHAVGLATGVATPQDCATGHEMSMGDQKTDVGRCDSAGLQQERLPQKGLRR